MNTASSQRQFQALDYFRVLAALLVVAIHTSPLASFSITADFILTRVLARIAVPFFFMVTGFFLLPPYLFDSTKDDYRLPSFLKKTFLLYLTSILLYLPINLYAGHFHEAGVLGSLRMIFFDGTFYHLWYFPAVLLGILIVCFLGRKLPFRTVMSICLLLYCFGLLGDSYYGFAASVPLVKSTYDALFFVFSYTRNGIFYAPVFLVMGAGLSQDSFGQVFCGRVAKYLSANRTKSHAPQERLNEQQFDKTAQHQDSLLLQHSSDSRLDIPVWSNVMGFVVFLTIMVAEGLLLHHFGMQRHDSMYIALLPCIFFLFWLLLTADQKSKSFAHSRTMLFPSKYLRTFSTYVYLLHPLFIILMRGFAKVIHLEAILIDNSLVHYIAVCILSSTASAVLCTVPHILPILRKKQFYFKNRAWIEINYASLYSNVNTLRSLLPTGCELMPAVKANAYGHGAVLVSKALNNMGIKAFCVASLSEGIELRRGGIKGDILVLGYTHKEDFSLLRKYHLMQTVVDYEYAKVLNNYGKKLRVHLKIDTGMHRLGERCEQFENICSIFELKNLVIEGIYTHLCADESLNPSDKAFTLAQAQAFNDIISKLKPLGITCPKIHLLSSYGLINYPELAGDYARVGIALYGVLSTRPDLKDQGPCLTPILSVKARIAVVKDLLQGESAGYGMQYIANHNIKIAVIAIGYADGLPRTLSCGKGNVLINGHKAPIIGNICMDQTIVDITGIPDVKAGDTAVIIGQSGEIKITAYDLAEQTETITNEVLSRLGLRLERILT